MTPEEFKDIRWNLKLNQRQLANGLGFKNSVRISEFETGLRPIAHRLGLLMQALDDGWRPHDWDELTKKKNETEDPADMEQVK